MRFCFPMLEMLIGKGERKRERRRDKKGERKREMSVKWREGRKRRRGRRRSTRGAKRKKKQRKRGMHPRGRPNGRAGHCTRLRECNSLQFAPRAPGKDFHQVMYTGAMPYLGVTLPAALTYPGRRADMRFPSFSLLTLRPLAPSSP